MAGGFVCTTLIWLFASEMSWWEVDIMDKNDISVLRVESASRPKFPDSEKFLRCRPGEIIYYKEPFPPDEKMVLRQTRGLAFAEVGIFEG